VIVIETFLGAVALLAAAYGAGRIHQYLITRKKESSHEQ